MRVYERMPQDIMIVLRHSFVYFPIRASIHVLPDRISVLTLIRVRLVSVYLRFALTDRLCHHLGSLQFNCRGVGLDIFSFHEITILGILLCDKLSTILDVKVTSCCLIYATPRKIIDRCIVLVWSQYACNASRGLAVKQHLECRAAIATCISQV